MTASADAGLRGWTVLVTRPAAQADALRARLAATGAQVLYTPLLLVEPLAEDAARRALVQDLDHYDIVIVTSRNAVQHGLPLLAAQWPQWPAGQRWLAVGAATAAALQAWQLAAGAPAQENSEGLLALPALQDVSGQRVLLLGGAGGRGLLEPALRARGARVDRLDVYRRRANDDAGRGLAVLQAAPGRRAVLVTSTEALQNLLAVAPWLADSGVCVVAGGARIAAAAQAAGLGNVATATGPDDDSMLAALAGAAGTGVDA